MRFSTKSILVFALILGSMMHSFADRGVRRKSKSKVVLNISTNTASFKNSLSYNLKNGLKYKGFILTEPKPITSFISLNGINSFQKGNTIYLTSYKQKIIVPELKQGYTGMKLIIKSRD
jgi:hypothetical protein